jgi:N6-adenosine-specific RNA methylase IME4
MSSPLPQGPFSCVLADPPWAFRQWNGKTATPHRGAHDHYVTTETSDLAALPVAEICADDCALFMWVVDSHLAEALDLGRAWGFEFKTCAFVWVKSRLGGWPKVGMGYWTRKQTEQCWLFTRGKPKRIGKGVEQIIHCPRGAHSAKPDQQYDAIERLVGGPRLEMFSRSVRLGWTSWGNEVGSRDGQLFEEKSTCD